MGSLIFTKEEDELIKQFYPFCKKEELLNKINKSWDQILIRARYLKIHYGQPCIYCNKLVYKLRKGLPVCNDCYYTSGGKCEICGSKCGVRAKYCLSCSRKIVGDGNRVHDKVFCKSCGTEISHLNKVEYCRKCSRHLKIGKVWKECIQCHSRFAVSKYQDNVGKGKFCSPKCCHEYRMLNQETFKHRYKFVSKIGKVISMRSTWEVRLAQYFDKRNIEFEYESRPIKTSFGWYFPDFYLESTKSYYEVKGYFTYKSKCKYEEAVNKGYVINILDKKALLSLGIILP